MPGIYALPLVARVDEEVAKKSFKAKKAQKGKKPSPMKRSSASKRSRKATGGGSNEVTPKQARYS
jgi:hypothetical protein